jgi:hypothetical protein
MAGNAGPGGKTLASLPVGWLMLDMHTLVVGASTPIEVRT